jgi:hypothetical protein
VTKNDPKQGASFTPKVGQANPEDLVRRIKGQHPDARGLDVFPIFKAEVLKDDAMVDACLLYYFVNAHNRLERVGLVSKPVRTRSERAAAREARKVKARAVAARIKRAWILDHVMPNGLKLRDCSFAYALEIGGGLERIGKMGPADAIIGQVLSDADAQAAMKEVAPTDKGWLHRLKLVS